MSSVFHATEMGMRAKATERARQCLQPRWRHSPMVEFSPIAKIEPSWFSLAQRLLRGFISGDHTLGFTRVKTWEHEIDSTPSGRPGIDEWHLWFKCCLISFSFRSSVFTNILRNMQSHAQGLGNKRNHLGGTSAKHKRHMWNFSWLVPHSPP